MSKENGPIHSLQVECAMNVAVSSCAEFNPKVNKEITGKIYTRLVMTAAISFAREMQAAAAKAKREDENNYQYWDRTWSNNRFPGESWNYFFIRMKNPQTVNITEAQFLKMRDQVGAHKNADEKWWEYWERTAAARKLPGESWSQYWIRTVVS